MRLAVVTSHPIQYQAPLFRELARRVDLTVFFSHHATPADQARAGFDVGFDWDVDLLSGYEHSFLNNVANVPGIHHFAGCDTPEIGNQLKKGRYTAVLVTGWHLKSFLQCILSAKRHGIATMARGDSQLNTHRSSFKKLSKALIYPGFLRLFDCALYVGQRSRAYWRHYNYPASRLFFSPHCVDTDWFAMRASLSARNELRSKLGLSENARVVLFAGKLLPFKRPLDIVSALAHLKRQGFELTLLVAGSGPLQGEIEALGNSARVSIRQLGFRNQTEMPAVYAAADVLVLPSDGRESWGLVANEALACGKPIVVSDEVGCAPDLAADGIAGRVFIARQIPALAEALLNVLVHPPKLKAIAEKSEIYSIRNAVHGILDALGSDSLKSQCEAQQKDSTVV